MHKPLAFRYNQAIESMVSFMRRLPPWTLLLVMPLTVLGCNLPAQQKGHDLRVAVRERAWDASSGGRELRTQHYQIFTTCSSRQLTDAVPGFMEGAYRNYLNLTGLDDRPASSLMAIYLMGDRRQWATLTQSVVGEQAPLYLAIEAGGYCYQKVCVFWDIGGLGTLATASHEGLHQFLACRMKNQLPMWLEEGLCTQAEGYQIFGNEVIFTPGENGIRYGDLRAAIMSDQWIPLVKLLPMDAGDAVAKSTRAAVGYYGQLWSLALFIRSDSRYRAGLVRLLSDAEQGKLNQAVGVPAEALAELQRQGRAYNRVMSQRLFQHYICEDLARFEKEYRLFSLELAKRM